MPEPLEDGSVVVSMGQEYAEQHQDYVKFALAMERTLSELLSDTTYKIDVVTSRAKTVASVRQKIVRKGYKSLRQMTDLCGIRVVCYYESEIEDIAQHIAREFAVIEDSIHGGSQPDTFGYVSRHLLVRLSAGRLDLPEWARFETFTAEIQIRTVLQHAWAAISHSLAYKTADEIPDRTRRRLARVAALLETGDEVFDVYRKEVSVLREEYRISAIGNDWESLPLNLDSVAATWAKLDLKDLAQEAQEAGWREPSFDALYESAETPIGNMDRASRLTRVAIASGLSTIGHLLDACRTARADRRWLVEVATQQTPYVPFAIGPDVLGLSLVSQFGEPVRVAATEGPYPYLDLLVQLAERCPRTAVG